MDTFEKRFFQSFEDCFIDNVDPVEISNVLSHLGFLPHSEKAVVASFYREGKHKDVLWNNLIFIIPKYCELRRFIEALYKSGCEEMAMDILLWYNLITHLPKSTISREGQELYMECKIRAHNNLPDPQKYCNCKSKTHKFLFEKTEDPRRKMKNADIYAACLGAEISSHIMQYDNNMEVDELFSKLEKLIPYTSNTHIAKISYHSHKVLVYAIREKFEEAEMHLRSAMESSIYIGSCIEVVNLFYVRLFFLLATYVKKPSERLHKSIIKAAEINLDALEGEQNEMIRLFWKRMILLRIVYCLLGLSYKGKPIPGICPDRNKITKAKSLLAEVYKLWVGMEARRKIAYGVAQARVSELENDMEAAVLRLDVAVKGDEGGNYGETEYIKQYSEKLQRSHQDTDTCVKEVIKSSNALGISEKSEAKQKKMNSEPRIRRTEYLDNGEAIKEYLEGNNIPVINLHGQNTIPKSIYSQFSKL